MEDERQGLLSGRFGDTLKAMSFMGPAGLFAGPAVRSAREKRELENKMLRDSIAAREEFTDLLGRSADVPVGPPQAPGPQQLWQNPAAGGALPQSPLPGPGGFESVPEYQTPEGQQKVLQLISRMGPDGAAAAAEAVMPGTQQRATAAMKEMSMFGYPMTQEGFQKYNEDRGGQTDPLTALLTQMQLARETSEQEERERTAAQEAQELRTEHRSFRNNLQTSGDSLMELARVNERLMGREGVRGALARPGVPFAQMRRDIASSFDETIASDIDTFNSLTNQIAISRLDTEGFDGNTNARFKAFTSTKPSFEAVGPANYMTIKNNLEGVLLADDAAPEDAKLPEYIRKKYEREVARLSQLTAGGGSSQGGRSVTLPNGDIVDNVPPNVTDEQVIQFMQQRR